MGLKKIFGLIILILGLLSFFGEVIAVSFTSFSILTLVRLLVFVSFILIGYLLLIKR